MHLQSYYMISHRLFLFVLVIIAVGITTASLFSNPAQEETINLVNINEFNFEDRLEDILRQFHAIVNNRINDQIGYEQAERGITVLKNYIEDGKEKAESVYNRIDLVDVTGNVIGLEESLQIYDQALAKSDEITLYYEAYMKYRELNLRLLETADELVNQRDILETQLKNIENEEAVQTMNILIELVDQQILLIQKQLKIELVNIQENELVLKDRTTYRFFLQKFKEDIQKVVVNPNINQDVAFTESDKAYQTFIRNSYSYSQLEKAYNRWYSINIIERFKEFQQLVVEFEDVKTTVNI